jgi:hypothetical protein
MPSPNVDLVFVLDASASMAPCFEQVKKHLHDVIKPMQGHVAKVNFALIAAAASRNGSGILHHVASLLDDDQGMGLVNLLYHDDGEQAASRDKLFTSDPERLIRRLAQIEAKGDEDMLLALDFALDLPFGPVSSTKRVVALFSDEPFESGVMGSDSNQKLPGLIDKILARHVQLFAAVPDGPGATQLASVDRAEIELIGDQGSGLADLDFSELFAQMGKSISGSSLQLTAEPAFQRALFEQDKWVAGSGELTGR